MKRKARPLNRLKFNIFLLGMLIMSIEVSAQGAGSGGAPEEYADLLADPNASYLLEVEDWHEVISTWLEEPLDLNSEADFLAEYSIISLFQLNTLREYRLIYGDLLSIYELDFIDGWGPLTRTRLAPLVTITPANKRRAVPAFDYHPFRHTLVIKSSFQTQPIKAYEVIPATADSASGSPSFSGSPVRSALRYDLNFRSKIAFGIRMEKDPGEPLLLPSGKSNIKAPDLLTGFLVLKDLGFLESVVLGHYRVSFGYGLNTGGSFSGIGGKQGMAGMAERIRPQTSLSESGFFQGICFRAEFGRVSVTGFGSVQKIDGSSLQLDTITGKVIAFSGLNRSGLHRNATEIDSRKKLGERIAGGFAVFRNHWLKAGIFGMYSSYSAAMATGSRPYEKFGQSGRQNLVSGFAGTFWISRLQGFTEFSISRNKGMAALIGAQFNPAPGVLVSTTWRRFGINYQNQYGSGFTSSGNNRKEAGILLKMHVELPQRYSLELTADHSRSLWVSYDLTAPARQTAIRLQGEKSWKEGHQAGLVIGYRERLVKSESGAIHLCKPENKRQYKLRADAGARVNERIRLQMRIECALMEGVAAGWMFYQDLEYVPAKPAGSLCLRICLFDAKAYDNTIFAYEPDVLYDYSTYNHYGKGLRGILVYRMSALKWIDLWVRLTTVYFTDKFIGTGWDRLEANRQNEIEIQVRLKWPGQ